MSRKRPRPLSAPLQKFFKEHDATYKCKPQYKSAIWVHDEAQAEGVSPAFIGVTKITACARGGVHVLMTRPPGDDQCMPMWLSPMRQASAPVYLQQPTCVWSHG